MASDGIAKVTYLSKEFRKNRAGLIQKIYPVIFPYTWGIAFTIRSAATKV